MKYIKIFERFHEDDSDLYKFCKIFLYQVLSEDSIYIYRNDINLILENKIESHQVEITYHKTDNKYIVISCSDVETIIFDKCDADDIFGSEKPDYMYEYWEDLRPAIQTNEFHYFEEFINDLIEDTFDLLKKKLKI